MQSQLGPTEFFTGAGTVVVERPAKVIKVMEAAAFTSLVMQFPALPAAEDVAEVGDLTFPPMFELRDVKSFQLASGSVQVIYHT